MAISDLLTQELDQEAQTTRRVLERVPDDKLAWKPHDKSMSLGQLALHVATVPGNVAQMAMQSSVQIPDFTQPAAATAAELVPTPSRRVSQRPRAFWPTSMTRGWLASGRPRPETAKSCQFREESYFGQSFSTTGITIAASCRSTSGFLISLFRRSMDRVPTTTPSRSPWRAVGRSLAPVYSLQVLA